MVVGHWRNEVRIDDQNHQIMLKWFAGVCVPGDDKKTEMIE